MRHAPGPKRTGNKVTAPDILHYDPRGDFGDEEELVKKLLVLPVALLWLAGAPNGMAQEQQQQSFRSIVGKGYEIKGVTFAKGDATENREAFVVTLQKEKSVAVCYFAAASWISLSAAALDDGKRCDVR
jgi:hypothetical protein